MNSLSEVSSPAPIISVSGIRGIFNIGITTELAESVGNKFGNYLRAGNIAVACDTRTTSAAIKDSLLSGLTSAGCSVYDLGCSSTPSVFKEVSVGKLAGGAVITASHNPPEWNGIKLVLGEGRGVFEEELSAILATEPKTSVRAGRVFHRIANYYEILKLKAGKSSATSVTVGADLAGGVGCLFIPKLLSHLGCKVHSINDSPGIFPRMIDPTADSLDSLSHTVRTAGCDVGFAFDCDADRLVIVDENGVKLSSDATLLICLRYFLENTRNRNVAISVDTSLAAEDLIKEFNGKVIYAKVGEANVLRMIVENNCGAGGEGSSGGYIEPGFVMCRDGVYGATIIARMIRSEGTMSHLLEGFGSYFQERAKVEADRSLVPRVLAAIASTEGSVDQTDGVKVRLNEQSWVLIRSSNTENVVRISAESKSPERAKEIVLEFSKKIQEVISDLRNFPSAAF